MTRVGRPQLLRLGSITVALAVVLSSCGGVFGIGGESEDALHPATAGDGVLDCSAGQSGQRQDLNEPVMGPSDRVAAEQALDAYLGADGDFRSLPPDGSWMAVVDDKDVALAYPTQTNDGWLVASITVCATAPVGLDAIDGSPDCDTDETWGQTGTPRSDAIGAASAELAVTEALTPYANRHGGDIVIEDSRGSLASDSKELVVASAIEMDNGTWVVVSIAGCAETR